MSAARRALLTLRHPGLAGAALIIVATCVAYLPAFLPALRGAFILDDETLLTENSLIKASDGLYRFWCTSEPVDYWPMTNTSFWLEWRLWGANPTGYHVTNLLLHIGAALLVWATLRKLAIPGAFLAALLFAVHPVNVESATWIAQRKNTLAMVFFLLSILWYLKADIERPPREHQGVGRWYGLSLLAFVLAMLSKGSVAILPLLLLGIAWWQRRRITKSDLAMTVPFFVVAIVFTGVNIWFQKHGTDVVIRDARFDQRLAGAGSAIWFYLAKALLPIDLVFVYPQWHIETGQLLWWLPLLAVVIVTVLLWWQRSTSRGRPLLAAWGLFCVALVPVLGFADVGFMKYSLVADHYQYIAIVGVLALVAAAWSAWHHWAEGPARWAAILAVVVSVGVLTFLTWQQSWLYGSALRLYEVTLDKNPDCWMAHNNLGGTLFRLGRPREAIEHYQQALRLKPDYAPAHINLGLALSQAGRPQEAINHFRQAIQLTPNDAEAHYNLGNALFQIGQPQEAIEHYQHALRLNPDHADAHYNLGIALAQIDRLPEAIEQYQQAIRLNPDDAEAYFKLAGAKAQMHRTEEAISAAQRAFDIAKAHGQIAQARQIEVWLDTHRAGQSDTPAEPSLPAVSSPQE